MRYVFCLILFVALFTLGWGQELYTARGYWHELNKTEYKKLRQKIINGDSLSINEKLYLDDHESFLKNYYERMSDLEKQLFNQQRDKWDIELLKSTLEPEESFREFEWRPKDRFNIGLYGFYYGIALATIGNSDGPETVGLPLLGAGLWQLGPIINPKKYDAISTATIRAGNSGKILGLVNGLSTSMMIAGDADHATRVAMALSTIGSISLGEVAFRWQKLNQIPSGRVELIRHYGFLGPGVGLAIAGAIDTDNYHAIGGILLAGGVSGILIGNKQSLKYNYTEGDVDAISSLTWIGAGLGLTLVSETLDNSTTETAISLIPATTAILGTILAQRSVRGIHLTPRQGSTLQLASGGAALIGLGAIALTDTPSATIGFGVPSVMALITHQLIFKSYRMKNLQQSIGAWKSKSRNFSMHVTPENYWVGKTTQPLIHEKTNSLNVNSVISLSYKF